MFTFTLSLTLSQLNPSDLDDSITEQINEDLCEMGQDVLEAADPCWIEESISNFSITCADDADDARDELAEHIVDNSSTTFIIDGDSIIVTLTF